MDCVLSVIRIRVCFGTGQNKTFLKSPLTRFAGGKRRRIAVHMTGQDISLEGKKPLPERMGKNLFAGGDKK
jgi:hypothetical protein